jgi:ribosomal protein L40E
MIQKYRKNSDISIVIAILLLILGLNLNNNFGGFLFIAGLILFMWAVCMYAVAKGYPWYIGVVASMFSVLGLLVLFFLHDYYKEDKSEETKGEIPKTETEQSNSSQDTTEPSIARKLNQPINKGEVNDFMYCQHCGAKIPQDSKFCPKCGNKTH